jgi:hypothetical protein
VVRTSQQSEEPEQLEDEEENQVTRPSDLGFAPSREIEVDRVQLQSEPDDDGYVQIRMARTIEEFTYGNPHINYHLEAGKIYRVPADIGRYLDSLEYVYH